MMFLLITAALLFAIVGCTDPTWLQQAEVEISSAFDRNYLPPNQGLLNGFEAVHQRLLQSSAGSGSSANANATTPSPNAICQSFNSQLNNASVPMNCTCARFASDQVSVNCTIVKEQCNSDQSFCFLGYVYMIINNIGQNRVTLSCTNSTRGTTLNTCVQMFPLDPGNFTDLSECYASLNNAACNYCSVCNSANATSMGTVTINCCNVITDAIATCTPFTSTGATFVIYDSIPTNQVGKCQGSLSPPNSGARKSSGGLMKFAVAIVVGVLPFF